MRVLKASWEITRRCNADCAHCYVDGSHDLGELNGDDVDLLLHQLFEGGIRFLTLVGGEPCVAPAFDQAVTKASEYGFNCKTITNGTIPREELIEGNRRGTLDVVVSILAGTNETFAKAYRLHPRLFETQRRVLSELRCFSVNISMFSANSAPEAAEQIAGFLAPFHGKIKDVSVFSATFNGRGIADAFGSTRDLQQTFARRLIGQLADVGIVADFNVDCADSASCPLIGATVPGEIFINPLGHIRPCHALVGYETSQSLLDKPLSELLRTSAMQRWRGNDPRYVFDRRCKATLMQSGMDTAYVEDSGGPEAFRKVKVELSPDLVLERYGDSWYGYLRNDASMLQLNDDAFALVESIQRGAWNNLIGTLDNEELADAVETVLDLEAASFVTVTRPTIHPGSLPILALSARRGVAAT